MGKKDDISKVAADKRELLIAAGYPIDYMDLHYECPICQDTGYVDGKKCTCFQIKANKMLYADKDTANIDKDTNAG